MVSFESCPWKFKLSLSSSYIFLIIVIAMLRYTGGWMSRLVPLQRWTRAAVIPGGSGNPHGSSMINTRLFSIKRKESKPEEWKLRQLHNKKQKKENAVASKQEYILDNISDENHYHVNGENTHGMIIEGTVIERMGDRVLVETSNTTSLRDLNETISTTVHHSNTGYLLASQRTFLSDTKVVVGDIVQINIANKDQPVVIGLNDRLNLLERAVAGRGTNKLITKSIASNIDQLLIVVSISPQVPTGTIDRFIVAAIEFGIPQVAIVVNKADLDGSREYFDFLHYYNDLGYQVVQTSSKSEEGLTSLIELLKGKTSVFVGQSGVGKSSLIKTLIPDVEIAIGDLGGVRKNVGAHTTSNSRLYHIHNKVENDVYNENMSIGNIIDSPGIRELGIWHLSRHSIRNGFVEIDRYATHCKFRNCHHSEGEDGKKGGCAVRKAVREGNIHPLRFESYQYLLR